MRKNLKEIPLFFAVDDNYAKLLAIALSSIIDNASKNYNYKVIVLNTGLNDASKELLSSLANDNFTIEYMDVRLNIQRIASDLSIRDYYTKTTYYRLFIAELYPQYDKCLYLDCDTIIKGDVSELYNTNIGENLVGAVPDSSVQIVPEFAQYTEQALGINHREYFNAGILVMNLRKMRENSFEKEFIELIGKYKFEVAQDQDYLNALCYEQVYFLNGGWNQMPIGERNDNAKIIHYNLSFKPWKYENIMYDEIFWNYAKALNLEEDILDMRRNFTPEMQERDHKGFERLLELCISESNNPNNYYHQFVEPKEIGLLSKFVHKIADVYHKFVS